MTIQWYAATEQMDRKDNQDFFFADEKKQLYVVADGMGGYKGGSYASKFVAMLVKKVIDTIDAIVDKSSDETIMPGGSIVGCDYENVLRNCFLESHEETMKKGVELETMGMGCTLVLLLFRNDRVYIMNAGDCRCYQYSEETLRQVTRDHSKVETMLREKKISKEEAHGHAERNIVTRYVGGNKFGGRPDTYVMPYYVNDRFVLCTDGVVKVLDDKIIERYVKDQSIKDGIEGMIASIKTAPYEIHPETGKKRSKDNATVMVVEIANDISAPTGSSKDEETLRSY